MWKIGDAKQDTCAFAENTMCVNAAGDVPPAGRDTDVYHYDHRYYRCTAAVADADAAAVALSQGKSAATATTAAAVDAAARPTARQAYIIRAPLAPQTTRHSLTSAAAAAAAMSYRIPHTRIYLYTYLRARSVYASRVIMTG